MLFVSNAVKEGKSKSQQKFYLKEKSLDLFGQFISVAERETDSMIRFAMSGNALFVFKLCIFINLFLTLLLLLLGD